MEFSRIETYREDGSYESKRHMLPLSVDYPRYDELAPLYNGEAHENIILICANINEGLAAAGRILNCCLGSKKVTDSEDELLNSIFYESEEEEPIYTVEPGLDENAFVTYCESEISKECNETGDYDKRKEKSDVRMHDISGQSKLIIVCDGMFALSDKLTEQLKATTGQIIVILPKSKANTVRINDLMFCKGFECYEIAARTRQYYQDLLVQYLDFRGFECLANTAAVISNLMDFRKNSFHEYDIKLLADKAIARAESKTEPWKALWDAHFHIDSYKRDETSGDDLLQKIIGLEKVKEMIKKQCAVTLQNKRMAEHRGIADDAYKSIAFKGSAGTGKTSCARAVSKIYAEAGITNGVFVEASRSDFVSAYVGETSQRVQKIFEQAAGGVLFIDEAGTLVTGTDSWDRGGLEALGAIVKNMDNMPSTVVIFATYDDEMEKLFSINEGLKSRISNIIPFEDYSTEQLTAIFKSMARDKGYALPPGYRKVIEQPYFEKMRKMDNWGNGRDVRKLLEAAIAIMAVQSKKFNTAIPLSAIRQAVAEALENQSPEKNIIGFHQE